MTIKSGRGTSLADWSKDCSTFCLSGRDGVRQTVVPITKAEITIGRGSRSVAVDLPLKGDPEISRVHAGLTFDDQGRFWLTPKGRNPTLVSGREIPREQRTVVQPDEKIGICSFTLRIQPR